MAELHSGFRLLNHISGQNLYRCMEMADPIAAQDYVTLNYNNSSNNNYLLLSGSNANQNINIGNYYLSGAGIISATISGANAAISSLTNGRVVFCSGAKLSDMSNLSYDGAVLSCGTASSVANGVLAGNVFAGTWNDGNTYAVFSHANFRITNSNTKYAFIQDSAGQSYFNSAGGQNLNFSIVGSRKMVLDGTTYDFGIGTIAPKERLHVEGGNICVSGAGVFKKNGSLGAGGTFTTADAKTVTVSGGIIISIV